MRPFLAFAVLASATAAIAQRPDAAFEHQKRAAVISYGAVPVGQHSLAKLPVGQSWRMGFNQATTWRTDMPLLAGDTVVAPGAYRVELRRDGETKASLLAIGSHHATGANADGQVEGEIGKCAKPTKKLAVEWRKKGAAAAGNQPAQIVVQFGESEWVGDVTVLGAKEMKAGGYKATVFTVPSDRAEKGGVPVAVLNKGEQNWNVVLDKDGARLVPWMAAPTEQFGFASPQAPEALTGKAEALEQKVDKPREVVEPVAAKVEKGEIVLDLGIGERVMRLTLPEPKGKPGK